MIVRVSKLLTVLSMLTFGLLIAYPPAAQAGGLVSVASDRAGVAQAGCGDGVCDAYVGENSLTCPKDCASNFVIQNATASPTGVLPTQQPTATTVPATPTSVPTSANGQLGCTYVSYESRTADWKSGYAGYAKTFVPNEQSNREVFVCTVPPFGQICLPITPGLLDSTGASSGKVMLVDCTSSGVCRTQSTQLTRVGSMLCSDVVIAGSISCTGGCALAPQASATLLDGTLSEISAAAVVPIACFLLFLLMAGVGLLIFVTRRSSRKELKGERALPATD